MKRRKQAIIALSALLLCAECCSFYMFKKHRPSTAVLQPQAQRQITFPGNIHRTINFLDTADFRKRPQACVYSWAKETTTPAEMERLLNGFGIRNINNKAHLLCTILYCNRDEVAYSLKAENIYGILVITNDEQGYMYTQLFRRNGAHFDHLRAFDAKIWRLYCKMQDDIAKVLSGRKTDLGYSVNIGFKESTYKEARRGLETDLLQEAIDKALDTLATVTEMPLSPDQ
ncbi:hypothetical protein [Edaphocola aurantiacus]|uniref:hypothetical protein n=1 Tax=Edaphocola aurantiacus TaxID=2601682 RepID=UPI001C96726B|nr:hypothetical protein [Edaphocola aurantiacus]